MAESRRPPMTTWDKKLIVGSEALTQNPELLNSINRNLYAFGTSANDTIENQEQIYEKAKKVERQALLEMQSFEWDVLPFWRAQVAKENENMDFFNSHIWKDEEIAKIKKLKLMPYSSQTAHRFMMSLLGHQRGTETKSKAFGKDPESQRKAEAQNFFLDWAFLTNKWATKEAQVFKRGTIAGRGASLATMDPDDPQGAVLMRSVRQQELMWDPVSAEDGSLEDCKYLWRGMFVDAEDLINKYPLFQKEIDGFNYANYTRSFLYNHTLANPKVRDTSDQMNAPLRYQNGKYSHPRRRVFIREFYRKGKRKTYAVYDSVNNVDHVFETPQEADYMFRTLRDMYAYAMSAAGQDPNIPVVAEPRIKFVKTITQLIFAGDDLIHTDTDDRDTFPYELFIPEYIDGEITGVFEHDKDHERLRSRFLIVMDWLFSGVKGKTWYNKRIIPKGTTTQEFEQSLTEATKPSAIDIPLDKDIKNFIYQTQAGNHGSLPSELLRFATEGQNTLLGGLSSIGQADYSQQSGVSMRQMSSSANIATVPLFAEWEDFQIRHAEKVSRLSPYISPVRVMATFDKRSQMQYARFVDLEVNSMANAEFAIHIEQVSASPSDRDQQANLLLALMHNNPEMVNHSFEEIADLAGVDRSRIDRIMAKMEQDKHFRDLLDERKQTLLEHSEENSNKLRWMEQARKMQETEQGAHPAPKINLTGKLPIGPALAASIATNSGINADPEGIAADISYNSLMEAADAVMKQRNWNDNLSPEQREALKGGNKAFLPKGVPKAKDTINRKDR